MVDLTLVTGATGFVGCHVVRALVARGEQVRVLVRSTSWLDLLEGLPVERAIGDLRDRASLDRAVAGCRRLYHVAADYRLSAPNPQELYDANVQGTAHLLDAATQAGVERIVYTSTVGALGKSRPDAPATEETPVVLDDMIGHYKRSKFLAEQEVVRRARARAPIVIVNPSTPVGPMDAKPTPTGQMIVNFLNGRMPGYVDTGMNLVHIGDVAQGHLLAMERGRVGEQYILGNRNLALREILAILAEVSGLPMPSLRVPHAVAMGVAVANTAWARLRGRTPSIPVEGVRMSMRYMYFDPSKAVRELGLPQTSVEQALREAVVWYRANGYVRRGGRGASATVSSGVSGGASGHRAGAVAHACGDAAR